MPLSKARLGRPINPRTKRLLIIALALNTLQSDPSTIKRMAERNSVTC